MSLSEQKSRPCIRRALDLHIAFFDTVKVHSKGSSEEIVGRALKDFIRCENIVLAIKVISTEP